MRDKPTEVGRYVVVDSVGLLGSLLYASFLEPASATASNTSMTAPVGAQTAQAAGHLAVDQQRHP